MEVEPLTFSIIIPTHDRPERLSTCLDSLTHLDYPNDEYEVIVVDDGSPASTEPVARRFEEALRVTFVRQEQKGPAAARNAGAEQARGTFLAFTDDDCRPHPGWLSALAHHFDQATCQMIGGRTVNALPDNPYSTASQLLVSYLYRYFNEHPDQHGFFASNNMAMPARCFHELDGFDTTFPLAAGEDREFCDRWAAQGYAMAYVPEAVVYHAHSLDARSFWRQHFNYGRGAFHYHQARRRRGTGHLTPEPLAFYQDLLSYPFVRRPNGVSAMRLMLLMGLSQVANAAGFFWESAVQRPKGEVHSNESTQDSSEQASLLF